ncbi:MAG: AAA family ATPase [Janthinobacterium lividum]
MKVLVLASAKGGASKTTLAYCMAVAAAHETGLRAVLIDMDPQGSLTGWWRSREALQPAMAACTVADLDAKVAALGAEGYDLLVIDTPPQVTASIGAVVALADLVVIPVRPSPIDLASVGRTVEIARKHEKPIAFVLAQATRGASLTTQALAALSAHGPIAGTMHYHVAHAATAGIGLSLPEHDAKAAGAKDIASIWDYVQGKLTPSTKTFKAASTKKKVLAHV